MAEVWIIISGGFQPSTKLSTNVSYEVVQYCLYSVSFQKHPAARVCTTVHPGPFVLNRPDRTLEMPLSKEPTKTLLGRDPPRQERLNGVSYQQNAIISHKGWQYAVFYTSKSIEDPQGPLLVSLSRRRKVVDTAAVWETLTLPDYEQVVDDSHNTISLGICPGDGTIHLSFDHHADR
jgi:hypothetical protein